MREEYEYFMNQTFKEIKRISMMNYDIAREIFVDLGEMNLRSIYDVFSNGIKLLRRTSSGRSSCSSTQA